MNTAERLLKVNVENLEKGIDYLQESYVLSQNIDFSKVTREDLLKLEGLTSRFGRLVDMLIHRTLRSLDEIEYGTQGTLIDLSNRAEKRELVSNSQELRELKTLRNCLVHEYNDADVVKFSKLVFELTPAAITIVNKTINYCREKIL